ncbi:MAG: primosomal protein N' [bacterium]|nr:primosomal protein N' [bacterium]
MNILTVIPITKGFLGENLTYFTKEEIKPGALVQVPLRRGQVEALVINSQPAAELKTALRQSDFTVKKITKLVAPSAFTPAFLQAAAATADYFAATLGSIIKSFTPQAILDSGFNFKNKSQFGSIGSVANKLGGDKRLKTEYFVLQEPDDERIGFYKSLIREAFAKKTSVLCLLPTVAEIEKILPELSKGISDYTIVLHSQLTKKEIIARWQEALNREHPILVVTTPLFLSLPRTDFKTIILDREGSQAYKGLTRPFTDARILVPLLAKASGAKLILGDLALRAETIFKLEQGEFQPIAPIKYRSLTEVKQEIIDLSAEQKNGGEWPMVSPVMLDLIGQQVTNHKKSFILVGRRGLAPATVCQDCGLLKTCPTCEAPLVLHQGKNHEENLFICHRCGTTDQQLDACRRCGSWRLVTLGIASEKIEAVLKNHFPKTALFRLDSDSVKTPRAAKTLISQFMKSQGSILIGTEMALYYLDQKVELTAALGIDSLLSLPDFRAGEKVFNLLLRTRQLASKQFIIETRNPEEKIYTHACQGNLLDFYRDELTGREELGWPPFATLIKLTKDGTKPAINDELKRMVSMFDKEVKAAHPMLAPAGRARYFRATILLELDAGIWVEPKLLAKLRALPPDWQVEVDPESLF